jgi:hypothetical protein
LIHCAKQRKKENVNEHGSEDHQEQSGIAAARRDVGSVSQACKMMGYLRDSFYRFKEVYD